MRNSNVIILSMEIVSLMERMGSVPIMCVKRTISIDKMIHRYGDGETEQNCWQV